MPGRRHITTNFSVCAQPIILCAISKDTESGQGKKKRKSSFRT